MWMGGGSGTHTASFPPCGWPQVSIGEDEAGRVQLRNLSQHRCDTEEQALNMVRAPGGG